MYELFRAEALPLAPDIVTLYAGNNDSGRIRAESISWFRRAFKVVGEVLIMVGFIDSLLDSGVKIRYSPDELAASAKRISDDFIDTVSRIADQCRQRGILLIVANQQINSQTIERSASRGLTYEAERQLAEAKMLSGAQLKIREIRLLVHAIMMKNLESWAQANRVPFVDVIGRLDNDRDVLVSWVHLSPRGNGMVAEAFADEILRYGDWH